MANPFDFPMPVPPLHEPLQASRVRMAKAQLALLEAWMKIQGELNLTMPEVLAVASEFSNEFIKRYTHTLRQQAAGRLRKKKPT